MTAGDVKAWIDEGDPFGNWPIHLGSSADEGAAALLRMSWEEAGRLAAWPNEDEEES